MIIKKSKNIYKNPGWGSLSLTDFYFNNWPSKIKVILSVITWMSCANGIEQFKIILKKRKIN